MAKTKHTTSVIITAVWPGVTLDGLDALLSPSIPGRITASSRVGNGEGAGEGTDEGADEGEADGVGLGDSVPKGAGESTDEGADEGEADGAGLGDSVPTAIGAEVGGGIMGIDIDMSMEYSSTRVSSRKALQGENI
jgi:hypothetical protein